MEELAPYMRGWHSYFGFCETPEVLIGLTRWGRLRLRAAKSKCHQSSWLQQARRRTFAIVHLHQIRVELCGKTSCF